MTDARVAAVFPQVRRREIFGWCCFDFANSAFTTIVITVVGLPYFSAVIAQGAPRAEAWWGSTLAASQALVIVLSPLVGIVADVTARKKRWLMGTALLCALATGAMFAVEPGQVALLLGLLLVANLAFSMSENICAAFLPELSTPQTAGRISGFGWSFGYCGGLVSLALALAIVMSGEGRAHWTFLMTAGFFLCASLPTLILVRERAVPRPVGAGERYVLMAWRQLARMREDLPQHRTLGVFFLGMTCYLSGLMAVIAFAAGFATREFGMSQNEVIILFAVLQLAGVAGAFGFGLWQDRIGPKLPLAVALGLWITVCVWAGFCRGVGEFFAIGVLAGLAMGSLQSASRAVVSTLTPAGRAGEFFGYWGFFGKLAGVIGPLLFGWLVAGLGYRVAILANAGFFLVGLLIVLPLSLRPAGPASRVV